MAGYDLRRNMPASTRICARWASAVITYCSTDRL